MEWIKRQPDTTGFCGAEAVMDCGAYTMALWDHEHLQGWQLYERPEGKKRRPLTGAGPHSRQWTTREAMQWAEQQMMQPVA